MPKLSPQQERRLQHLHLSFLKQSLVQLLLLPFVHLHFLRSKGVYLLELLFAVFPAFLFKQFALMVEMIG